MLTNLTNQIVTFVIACGLIVLGNYFKPEIVDYVRAVGVALIMFSTIPSVKAFWVNSIDYVSYAEMVSLQSGRKADTDQIEISITETIVSLIFVVCLFIL